MAEPQNQPLSVLARDVHDTGILDRIEIQIAATALSIYLNASTTPTKKQWAKSVYDGRRHYAEQWAPGIRVSGIRITRATLEDEDIIAGVETIMNAFAPAEP